MFDRPLSYTMLSTFKTCPAQFEAKYITKTMKNIFSQAATTGVDVHQALENHIKYGAPVAGALAPYAEWVRELEGAVGTVEAERTFCVGHDGKPTTDEWGCYMKATADMFVPLPESNLLVDWKTGKVRDNRLQAEMLAMCTSAMTGVTVSDVVFVFTNYNDQISHTIDTSVPKHTALSTGLIATFQDTVASGVYKATPSGICRAWCGNLSCIHNGRGDTI